MSEHQVCYFPYLFLGDTESIEYDGIVVWNFGESKRKRIPNKDIRANVSQLLSTNKRNNKTIKDIGVITVPGNDDFKPLDEEQSERVNDVRKALFLAVVAQSNVHGAGHFMATSENFIMVLQNFVLGSKYTAFTSGKIVAITSGGWKVGEINYEMPRYVPTGPFRLDVELLNVLQELKHRKRKYYRLVLRATDSMMNGYSNSDDQSYESSILEQCRSFEILFGLPLRDQRKVFKEKIKKYCSSKSERKVRYRSERGASRVWEIEPRQVMWADKFYTLRNHIIHGEKIEPDDFKFRGHRHWDLGLWFFLVSVKNTINLCLGRKIFYDAIYSKDGKFQYDKGLFSKAFEKASRVTK